MSARIHLRWLAAASLLCALARPAWADGVFLTDDEWNRLLLVAACVVVGGILVLILVIRLLVGVARERRDEPADPPVPTARVVHDRDRP